MLAQNTLESLRYVFWIITHLGKDKEPTVAMLLYISIKRMPNHETFQQRITCVVAKKDKGSVRAMSSTCTERIGGQADKGIRLHH